MFRRFVIPKRLLQKTLDHYKERSILPIIDYAVEHNNNSDAFEYQFETILREFPYHFHAMKLSGCNLCPQTAHRMIQVAREQRCNVLIDAENAHIQSEIDMIATNEMMLNPMVFKTYQMYRKDGLQNLLYDLALFQRERRMLNVKLVRGAYHHTDKQSGELFMDKHDTDTAYNVAVNMILKNEDHFQKVIFATHNRTSFHMIKDVTNPNFYHASLMGFDHLFDHTTTKIKKMVYVPFGPMYQTYPYLLRRLYENPIQFFRKRN